MMPPHAVCAEIGVFRGTFSARILRSAQPKALHLIDPWKFHTATTYRRSWYGGTRGKDQTNMDRVHAGVLDRFREEIAAGTVHIHRCTSAESVQRFPDDFFDWVYIDGNHLYEFVKSDLESFYPKVTPGGFIAGDDYGVKGWWDGGVTRAVDEFAGGGRFEKALFKHRQFVLRKRR